MQNILLASSSTYRHQLLSRLGLAFEYRAPDIDETAKPNETADQLVARLAQTKAIALGPLYQNTLIIGCDQVAVLDGNIIGKPHTYERALAQLRAASGKTVLFKTGLCLLNTSIGRIQLAVEEFSVCFRSLTNEQIDAYLSREQPYDCAGSFKCEGLGIALFTSMQGSDPNTLIGLPLIRLVDMLINEGVDPLLAGQ
jgi:septum formation protein